MDNYLIPAALVLVLTNSSFAYLAWHWRRQAKRHAEETIRLALVTGNARKEGHDAGYTRGAKIAVARMYRAAARAHASEMCMEVLRMEGHRLTGETEPLVQVHDLVSHESADL